MERSDGTAGEVLLEKTALELTQRRACFSFPFEEQWENGHSEGWKELEDSRS